MTFNRWLLFVMLWLVLAFLGSFSAMTAVEADETEGLNALFDMEFVTFPTLSIGNPANPISYVTAGGAILTWGASTLGMVFRYATFDFGIFVGDWQFVRYFFFVALGGALVLTYGQQSASLLLDAARTAREMLPF